MGVLKSFQLERSQWHRCTITICFRALFELISNVSPICFVSSHQVNFRVPFQSNLRKTPSATRPWTTCKYRSSPVLVIVVDSWAPTFARRSQLCVKALPLDMSSVGQHANLSSGLANSSSVFVMSPYRHSLTNITSSINGKRRVLTYYCYWRRNSVNPLLSCSRMPFSTPDHHTRINLPF